MSVNIMQIPVAVIVWTQEGCPACEDYIPRFLQIAKRYERCLPILIVDVNRFPEAADAFGVMNTPTTFVSRYGQRSFRFLDGDVPEYAIESLFQAALRGLDCAAT
jgi:thiol-disulfide isomerase/thioredoxin